MTRRMTLVTIGLLALGPLLLGACGEIRAERQGKQAGEAICDIKGADDAEDAQRQLAQAQRQVDDLQRIVGRPVAEDVSARTLALPFHALLDEDDQAYVAESLASALGA